MQVLKKIQNMMGFNSCIRHLQYAIKADNLTQNALRSTEAGVSEKLYNDKQVIVSLTTFGSRIKDSYLSIESIMLGSMKPNKIVLWLGLDEKGKPLPITLKKQMKRGLEVKYTEDIRSYTKLVPSLRDFPEDIIITIDDDIIYNYDLVENLYLSYLEDPECIHANRVHVPSIGKDGKLTNYSTWKRNQKPGDISYLNFLTGVGGVLYPPHCFNEEVFNKEVFLDICKYADDIWFYSMAIFNGRKIKKAPTHKSNGADYLYPEDNQEIALHLVNTSKGRSRNDDQLEAVFQKYNLFRLLNELA